MLHHEAPVHYHFQAVTPQQISGFRIVDAFLHPNELRSRPKRRIHQVLHEFRPPKHVNYIHGFRDVLKPRKRRLSESFVDFRIHGQNLVSGLLQISRHAVACPPRLIGQPDDGDCPSLTENLGDFFVVHFEASPWAQRALAQFPLASRA